MNKKAQEPERAEGEGRGGGSYGCFGRVNHKAREGLVREQGSEADRKAPSRHTPAAQAIRRSLDTLLGPQHRKLLAHLILSRPIAHAQLQRARDSSSQILPTLLLPTLPPSQPPCWALQARSEDGTSLMRVCLPSTPLSFFVLRFRFSRCHTFLLAFRRQKPRSTLSEAESDIRQQVPGAGLLSRKGREPRDPVVPRPFFFFFFLTFRELSSTTTSCSDPVGRLR